MAQKFIIGVDAVPMTLTNDEIRNLKAENLRLREFIEEVARCQDSTGKAATALLTELGY